jgi:predicted nucleic acid-binding Zn ribbon protein
MSRGDSIRIGDAFKKFLKEENLEQSYLEKKLISTWGKLMGPVIAERTLRIFIKEKVMYVTLSSAPLKNELTNMKEQVLKKIEEEIGQGVIDSIRFI